MIAGAAIYSVLALAAACSPWRVAPSRHQNLPRVSVLKPLCGADSKTYECLRSFCNQTYPEFQIVFGVAAADDPVLSVVRRLQEEFPRRDLRLCINRSQHGSSRKVSNLINMMSEARYEYLVIADSDVCVGETYLTQIVTPLLEPEVGIVTCAYRGVSGDEWWSLLGCSFINEWFTPSVYVAAKGGSRSFAFGASIALRREVLSEIGGFNAIANQLADDYRLGELTRRLGLRTVLSEMEVDVVVGEASLSALVQHELRWLRTIRALRPMAYNFCFVTFGTPIGVFGALLTGGGVIASSLLAVLLASRLLLHLRARQAHAPVKQLVLIPLRDCLSLLLWAWSFTNRRVRWRNEHLEVSRDGSVLSLSENV